MNGPQLKPGGPANPAPIRRFEGLGRRNRASRFPLLPLAGTERRAATRNRQSPESHGRPQRRIRPPCPSGDLRSASILNMRATLSLPASGPWPISATNWTHWPTVLNPRPLRSTSRGVRRHWRPCRAELGLVPSSDRPSRHIAGWSPSTAPGRRPRPPAGSGRRAPSPASRDRNPRTAWRRPRRR